MTVPQKITPAAPIQAQPTIPLPINPNTLHTAVFLKLSLKL